MDHNFYAAAARAKAERVNNKTPNLRDRTQHLINCPGTYVVGSSTIGCYKIGYGVSLRDGIGRNDSYSVDIDVIMWLETDGGKQLSEQLHAIFQPKTCKVPGTPGEWFALTAENLETLRTQFGFQHLVFVQPNRGDTAKFKLENFRPFQGGCVTCWSGSNGAVLIKRTGDVIYGRLKDEKKHLLSRYEVGDILLLSWHGQWRTDVFAVSPADFVEPEEPTDLRKETKEPVPAPR
jgi:hypothetical protein